jgi:rhodanese-related sulfurtransferase
MVFKYSLQVKKIKNEKGAITMRKIAVLFVMGICTVMAATVFVSYASAADFKIIKAEEAKKMMDAGHVVIVDVRRPDEFAAGHIKNAINIPNETITTDKPQELPNVNATLLVYCRTGIRAADASGKLVKMGYKNVYDMGGIRDWPYETVK